MSLFSAIFSRQFLLTLFLIGLLALFVVPLTKNWRQKQAIDSEISELKKQVAQMENKNSSLQQILDYMQSDQFVEQEARSKLNYKKPGEEVTVIQSQPTEAPSADTSTIFDLPPAPEPVRAPRLLGNVANWLNYFFKK